MIPQIKEINFPEYATLSTATATLADMGDMTINAQVKIDGNIVPNFSYDWEVEFKGERYIQPLREPQASKGNDSISSIIDLTFYHWAIYEMKRNYFVEMTSTESGTPIADKYNASLGLNLGDFCTAFQQVLDYYYDGRIVIDLNPNYKYEQDVVFISINYSYIWDVLQSIHPNYGVRWHLQTIDNVCYIKVGYPSQEISHIFEYGFEGGLMKIERQVQNSDIRNRLLGRGGEQNLPAYYFKEAPEGSLFASDPDAIPELANIEFTELRGKTFRYYIKGWKAQRYGGEPMSEPTEEYNRGYTDEKFSPIEYVDDAQSIQKYGVLIGALENLEGIYPSIQEVEIEPYGRIDEVVAVSEVTNDDIEQSVDNNVVVSNLEATSFTWNNVGKDSVVSTQMMGAYFIVPEGKTAILDGVLSTRVTISQGSSARPSQIDNEGISVEVQSHQVKILNTTTGKTEELATIPAGSYYYLVDVELKNISDKELYSVTASYSQVKLISRNIDEDDNSWKPTFDIWVKNLWNTTRNNGESDTAYTNRVWTPILGANGEDAVVNFGSGWLAVSDYDFVIKSVAYDNSKSYNGVKSEWRLTLYKTDAELEATGKYLPNSTTNGNAKAGDYFYFTGIELPHQYTLWAEENIDERKSAELTKTSNINPTWIVNFDKIRLNTLSDYESKTLFEQIVVGAILRTSDSRFITDKDYLSLYITSINYQFGNGLLPDIEVVLSDKQLTSQSPLSKIQGEIDGVYKQLGILATAETAEVAVSDIVRKVGGKIFLRKDGQEDKSLSPTIFSNLISNDTFRQGLVGGAGWGIYQDEYGNTIIEADKINVRQEFRTNSFVSHQVSIIGGTQIISSASMECSKVVETENGYQCFFEQRDGSLANEFVVNDIAYSQVTDPYGATTKYYKRIVTEVSDNYIVLSNVDTEKDGNGIPEVGDIIAQFGNTTDKQRQGVIIFSTYGEDAPSIRQYANVDSFSLVGKEITKFSNGENVVTGTMKILPNSEGATNFSDLKVGSANLLRNSGFTGEYISRELGEESELITEDAMWSEPLIHWEATNAQVEANEKAQSGYQITLNNGSLAQILEYKLLANEHYVLSFYGKGNLNCEIGDVSVNVVMTNEFAKHTVPIKSSTEATEIIFTATSCSLYDLQLERGTIATDWTTSGSDNDKSLSEVESMRYLQNAMNEGSTEILGGLVLSNIIKVGNYVDKELKEETGGMSGVRNTDSDVAFWAGGNMEQAINTVNKYKEDATYLPTQEELAEMAKFVVTHGGRAILNDIILRGYIYALGGEFVGMLTNRKTVINNNNIDQYFDIERQVNVDVYVAKIEKVGAFVTIDPTFNTELSVEFNLPHFTIGDSAEQLDYVRSFLGCDFALYNYSEQDIYICNSVQCHKLESGKVAYGVCVLKDWDNAELVDWDITITTIKQ